ncbi:MAG: DASS family sodium-coupled anion symporter [Phycisphaerales bacterium]|nr:MAG: DASS family sodium-coupled anion symporter [Phycisphaerales bacterium]
MAWVGRIGAPILALAVYWLLPGAQPWPGAEVDPGALSDAGRAVAAVGVLMAVLWVTEALPLPATALLPLVLFPVLGVMSPAAAASPFADRVIFLFMGGFMLALAMERWGLHRRIALATVLLVGTRPPMLIGGFMLATAVLSMWMSNTATTVMMLPIGVSIIGLTLERLREAEHEFAFDADGNPRPLTGAGSLRFATCLMLGIAYAASIGGVGTLIGTPPNAFLAGFVREAYGVDIGFGQWMLVGVPLALVMLFITWLLLTRVLYPTRIKELPGGRELIRDELRKLGPVSRAEWTVMGVFVFTALSWVLREPLTRWAWLADRAPGIRSVDDAAIAIVAAILLFAIPVNARKGVFTLNWESAVRLPWGVLLLFGGGLSLAAAVRATGVDAWIGHHVGALDTVPIIALVLIVIAVVIFLTELTSNTATAATFLPVLGGVALGIGADPLLLIVPAALAASCAFMMPVATPPNAIVFGSGHVTIGQMVRAGFWLNLISIMLITAATYALGAWALGITIGVSPVNAAP